ncbi:hypothetical protein ACWDUC_13810 [Streptomyces tricolor]|uniref:Secreted protein n=1 Tax=Streptomyces tricolor TaxID=68277 RepID=A0ABS9JI48_9ACTN|nr:MULTISPECIES: hypothetical protein [Streptomyces]MCG0065236.1 hypothetical protein [Streptomyces tricolor]OYP18921.1 hypothetical protein CFC35_34195 [Streptomyces sp. FBKL.4005]BCM71671.1 hypothetical protein EASAB2608_07005 [Streptomyces sp. EAS-AB2608]
MRRLAITLAAALGAVGGVMVTTAQAAPTAGHREQPPYPYASCLAAAKQHGESPSYAVWHCDQLVQKGWVLPPRS